ncbi:MULTISPECIES: anhydro-N-acetylmuramic acid kinase [unclassified Herbaspirillum]|uniref:anhydro-N-acetylmuramic acid kinase n=1 Tax=unclassified Herbaspirillum TaxID=2624150 RepID=UPI001150D9AC|nr:MULTISPECIES: anhydro-N-acetylmuramic acid kinase [unclassified Herbaspirillum]MBB5392617.1 anhydro-N-acetylmuramic acid kinase [Herbaspirillum sp. SJZ102]TQK06254.1 anhydro-N-acetylmuramic acid kinase [Herbaspirillum sp. SJZ130]TQK12268.1 anhydro-N-acetylmuramic acid kinase [Herbaspirillum sp. SJZ106]TWC68457.1 anhydro-N-acetylmuramic acid kinase [Herbaspirillum sp. SJZ099]
MPASAPALYIGLMSGTSLDGVDGVLAAFAPGSDTISATLAAAYVPFPEHLRADLMALQAAGPNEIEREALAANALAVHYADCVAQLLRQTGNGAADIRMVGVHGQTIRHRPELGFTRQTNNPALLAELSGIDVAADFRSRDVAAGGQGAPLVPAFHRAVFGHDQESRVVVNIGGIANISILPAGAGQATSGFDTGPGNALMDAWIKLHKGQSYDANGDWGATGQVHDGLLRHLRDEHFFLLPPPKSSGRDLFHLDWLQAALLKTGAAVAPADVQATLAMLTAGTIADAIATYAPDARKVYVCGGGAENGFLMRLLQQALQERASVQSTAALGIAPNQVEALAFAWLACRFDLRLPGNLPAVTGARGLRVLGALYPAH